MNKIFIVIFTFMLWGNVVFASNFTYIEGLGHLQLGNLIKAQDTIQILGSIQSVRYIDGPADVSVVIESDYGKFWLQGVTNENPVGNIGRLITSKSDVKTSEGITIGSTELDVLKIYRTPNHISTSSSYYSGIIKWYIYYTYESKGLKRLLIGFTKENLVGAIGFSGYAGGL